MATVTIRPNAAGTTTQLDKSGSDGENWDRVDEETADDLTTYVQMTGGTAKIDTYNIPDQVLSGVISNVTVYARCLNTSSSEDTKCRPLIRIGGSNYPSSGDDQLTTSWVTYSRSFDNNPNTSAAWTWNEINSLEIGVYLVSYFIAIYSRCTQVYVIVTYTPAGKQTQVIIL